MPIKVNNLKFTYSPKTAFAHVALDDITVRINDGDYIGIIGHTGSGKSTFLQHLNGLTKLQSGEIIVDDIDLSKKYDYKKLRSKVGMVFQYPEYQLFESTVERDVAFGVKNIKLPKEEIQTRVQESLTSVGLDYELIKDKSPFEISGGQKRRVALAGVIAMEPSILVLDEPTAGLDPVGKRDILDLIDRIRKNTSHTIIIISHNMDEVAENCNRVFVLSEGKLVFDMPPQELFSNGEELKRIGLDLPTVVKIRERLREKGFEISDVYKKEDLINEILRVKGVGR